MVDIVIDVTVDLPQKIIKEYNIHIVPLYVIKGKEKIPIYYKSKYHFYKKFKEDWLYGRLKTSQPTIEDFLNVYKSCENDILVFTISSKLSGTYNVALSAAKMVNKKVYVIDTENASIGSGLLVLLAIKLLRKYRIRDVLNKIEKYKRNIKSFAFLQDVRYLLNSGRINAVKYSFLKLLNKKPIITVKNGKLELFKLSSNLINDFYELDRKFRIKLYASNTKKITGKEILMNPIISIHLGPSFTLSALDIAK